MTKSQLPDVFALVSVVGMPRCVLSVYCRLKHEKHLRLVERSYHGTLKEAKDRAKTIAPGVEVVIVDNEL